MYDTKRIYSHSELSEKLEAAQLTICALHKKPDQTVTILALQEEVSRLHDHIDVLIKQRNDLLECLRYHNPDLRMEVDRVQ